MVRLVKIVYAQYSVFRHKSINSFSAHKSVFFVDTSLKFLVYKDKESIQPMPGGIYLGYWFLAAVYDAL